MVIFNQVVFLAGKTSSVNLQIIFWLMILGTAVKAGGNAFSRLAAFGDGGSYTCKCSLHAVAVVKAGVFGIVRIVGYVFGPLILSSLGAAQILTWLAALTIIVSSLIALAQDNLKRRLAFPLLVSYPMLF